MGGSDTKYMPYLKSYGESMIYYIICPSLLMYGSLIIGNVIKKIKEPSYFLFKLGSLNLNSFLRIVLQEGSRSIKRFRYERV